MTLPRRLDEPLPVSLANSPGAPSVKSRSGRPRRAVNLARPALEPLCSSEHEDARRALSALLADGLSPTVASARPNGYGSLAEAASDVPPSGTYDILDAISDAAADAVPLRSRPRRRAA